VARLSIKIAAVPMLAVIVAALCICAHQRAFAAAKITVTSASFKEDQMMPERHAYDRDNLSPSLEWSGIPAGAATIAVICDDPDAPSGNWVHWVIFNIPASASRLQEGMPIAEQFDDGIVQGTNDFMKPGYDGPYPPFGTHRYVFTVYALDTVLDLAPGATRQALMRAMAGHVLGTGSLTGRYKRKIDSPKQDVIE